MNSKDILQLYNSAKRITDSDMLWAVFETRDKDYPLAYDTETTSLSFGETSYLYVDESIHKPYKYPFVFGMSMCIMNEERPYLLWVRYDDKELFKAASNILQEECLKTVHNAKYDLRCLKENGTIVAPDTDCTHTMSRIYYDRRRNHKLKKLIEFVCPQLSQWEDPIKKELTKIKTRYTRAGYPKDYANYSFIPDKLMSTYAIYDAFFHEIMWIWFDERACWRE
jgi:DNA polymerase I-like protein with 3'-5' exonuclease and polymerase domains